MINILVVQAQLPIFFRNLSIILVIASLGVIEGIEPLRHSMMTTRYKYGKYDGMRSVIKRIMINNGDMHETYRTHAFPLVL